MSIKHRVSISKKRSKVSKSNKKHRAHSKRTPRLTKDEVDSGLGELENYFRDFGIIVPRQKVARKARRLVADRIATRENVWKLLRNVEHWVNKKELAFIQRSIQMQKAWGEKMNKKATEEIVEERIERQAAVENRMGEELDQVNKRRAALGKKPFSMQEWRARLTAAHSKKNAT